ncbi:MAG: type II toxin-antitoxin system HicB family antitoxin [bacterium]|nr:type II toxin-antitoxin system HicB family antitoxin [bacterium]
MEYNAVFTAEKEGGFSVVVPDLPGCVSQGENFEEALANIKEAIELYLEDAKRDLFHTPPAQIYRQFMAPVGVQLNG